MWANARACVVGEFNFWDSGYLHAVARFPRHLGDFRPRRPASACVTSSRSRSRRQLVPEKADPLGSRHGIPATASVVTDYFHEWTDDEWMCLLRRTTNPHSGPMSILHEGSTRVRGVRAWATASWPTGPLRQAKSGLHAREFMPLAEHPFGGSWGHQVTSYRSHLTLRRRMTSVGGFAGIGVILNWCPPTSRRMTSPWRASMAPLCEDRTLCAASTPTGVPSSTSAAARCRNFLVANACTEEARDHVDGAR